MKKPRGDLAERVRELEQRLAEQDLRYTALATRSRDIILFIREEDGRIVEANEAAVTAYGYSRDELLSLTLRDVRAPESLGQLSNQLRQASSADGALFDTLHRRRDGSIFPVEVNATMAPIGGVATYISIIRDITARRQREVAHAEAVERLARATRIAHLGIWDWDISTDRTTWDGEMFNFYGITRESFTGRGADYFTFTRQDYRAAQHANVEQAFAHGVTEDELRAGVPLPYNPKELCIVRPDGTEVFTLGDAIAIVDDHGKPQRMVGVTFEITERKRAEQALQERERELREAERLAHVGHWMWDTRTNGVLWSDEMKRMWGLDPAEVDADLTAVLEQRIHPDDRAKVDAANAAVLNEAAPAPLEYRIVLPDGAVRVILATPGERRLDDAGHILQLRGVVQDVTELRRAERERAVLRSGLMQAQKMESVGRLAGGIAHDFNNMLSVILGHVDFALESLAPTLPAYDDLQQVRRAAVRSADLTRQLLAFARKQPVTPVVLDLNQSVGDALRMLQRLLGENIRLVWRPAVGSCRVYVDPSQLSQVLTNLCVNARDAIADTGELTIETAKVTLTPADCVKLPDAVAGDYVRCTVRDSGCGMDEATIAQIFEPFFTTKQAGVGTGLGLSTVYGIVRQNGGFISVASTPGHGSAFDIYWPRHAGHAAGEPDSLDPAPSSRRGTETILLVEDEPGLLRLTERALVSKGYTVLATGDPEMASRVAAEHAGHIDLLLTDVVMPGMNGWDLADALTAVRPALQSLFMSGFSPDTVRRSEERHLNAHFIAKPFSMAELTAKVRAVLDDRSKA